MSNPEPRPETYTLHYGCINCGHKYDIEVEKGKSAPRRKMCPYCGCCEGTRII